VFALGAVLYFLLTGRPPFEGPNVAATLDRARRCEFDRVALDRPTPSHPCCPRRLREVCLKAMAADPADRYARAEDLADDLDRFLTHPRRLARAAGLAVAAVLLVAVTAGLLSRGTPGAGPQPAPAHPASAPPALELVVTRNAGSVDLAKAVPLDPARDRVQVVARVPPGHHAVLLHVNARGKVKVLPARASPADAYTRLVFPGDGMQVPFEPGLPGTEVMLVCAAEDPAALADLDQLAGSLLAGLPSLPPHVLVWVNRDEPRREARPPFGKAEPDPTAQVEHQLDQLRQRLRERPLSVIRGVAYSR
jgi:hypothetical protein